MRHPLSVCPFFTDKKKRETPATNQGVTHPVNPAARRVSRSMAKCWIDWLRRQASSANLSHHLDGATRQACSRCVALCAAQCADHTGTLNGGISPRGRQLFC